MIRNKKYNQGFVVFVALFVVLMVTAIGITIINITLKEFRLAKLQQDSLQALFVADQMIECAFHHDVSGLSAFPSLFTISLDELSEAPPLGQGSVDRKTGGVFPNTIDCIGGTSFALTSSAFSVAGETIIETRIPATDIGDSCVEMTVRKINNIVAGRERTEVEARGIKTDNCGSAGVERALDLVWETRQ